MAEEQGHEGEELSPWITPNLKVNLGSYVNQKACCLSLSGQGSSHSQSEGTL